MSARPAITIVVVAGRWCFRGDFSAPASEPLGFWRAPRSADGNNHAAGVRAALALGGRAGARVWVLSEDVWVQSLELPRHQTAGLTSEQLSQALAFEVEPFSNLTSGEAALGYRLTDAPNGKILYRIAEMARSDREAVESVVRRVGGRLAGLGHPGELPRRPDSDDEAALRQWLASCAGVLERSPHDLPLIPPPERRLLQRNWARIAVAAELAALLVGCSMGGCAKWLRGSLQREFGDVERKAQAGQALADRNTQLKQRIAGLREARADLNRKWRDLNAQRRAPAELLRMLALQRPDNVVIERIRNADAENVEITGLCLDARSADDMAATLASAGKTRGWVVHPLRKKACRLLDNGGPWEFAWTVTRGPVSDFAPTETVLTEAEKTP